MMGPIPIRACAQALMASAGGCIAVARETQRARNFALSSALLENLSLAQGAIYSNQETPPKEYPDPLPG